MSKRAITIVLSMILGTFSGLGAYLCATAQLRRQSSRHAAAAARLDGELRAAQHGAAATGKKLAELEKRLPTASTNAGGVDPADQHVPACAQLAKERDEYKAVLEQRLHDVYRRIGKVVPGRNTPKGGYVKSFTIEGNRITFELVGISTEPIRPSFVVEFLNKHGLSTATVTVSWVFDEIKRGERRFEEATAYWRHGPPYYWTMRANR